MLRPLRTGAILSACVRSDFRVTQLVRTEKHCSIFVCLVPAGPFSRKRVLHYIYAAMYAPAFVSLLLFFTYNKRTKACRLVDVSLIYLRLFCVLEGSRCGNATDLFIIILFCSRCPFVFLRFQRNALSPRF